jgi:hypothetical protein
MSKKLVGKRCLVLCVKKGKKSFVRSIAPLNDAKNVEYVLACARMFADSPYRTGQVKLVVANVPHRLIQGQLRHASDKCGAHYGAWRHVAGVYAISASR